MKTRKFLSLILLCTISFSIIACGTAPNGGTVPGTGYTPAALVGADLMAGVTPRAVEGKPADSGFVSAHDGFAAKLFKSAFAEADGENVLVSPLSVTLALAMTANGAKGQTLAEMERLLGGEMSVKQLNEYLKYYVANLYSGEKCKLNVANSIWFRDDEARLAVNTDFLQTNADYYGASAYKKPFDDQTLNEINGWVKENTDGMIDKIIEEISPEAVMYLINAIVFDSEWESKYEDYDIEKRVFTTADGTVQKDIDFMHSCENVYLEYKGAKGFKKQYSGGGYSFAAVLPPENAGIAGYVASLDGETLASLLGSARSADVSAYLPKFTFDYDINLNDTLIAMGMPTAFDPDDADLSGIGGSAGNLYIGNVIHKTHIEVDARGTKAAAVTAVEIKDEGMAMPSPEIKTVVLDRPFVFMILDNSTGLPVFIGAVMSVE